MSSRRELVPSGSRLEKKRLYDSDDDDDDDDDGSDDERVLNAVPDDDDDDDEGVTPNAISTGPRRSPRLVKLATSFSDTQLTPEENTESETEPQTPSDEFTAETLNIDVQTLHDIIEESSDIGNAVKDEARKKLAAYRNENTSIAVVGHLGQGKSYTINCLVAPKSFLLKHSSGAQVGFAPLRSKRGGQSCTTTPVVIDKDPSNSDSFSISYVRYTLSDEKDKSKNPTLVSKTEEPVKSNLTFTEACDLLEGLSDTDHGRDTVLHLQGPFSLPDKITLYDTPGIGDDPEQDGPYITPLMRHLLCEADVLAIVSQRAASREEVSALIKRGALSGVFTKAESKTPVVLSIYRADEYDSENDLSLARKQIVRAIDRLITDQEVIAGVEFEDDKLRLVDMIRRNIQVFSSSQLDEGHDRAVRCLNNVRACSLTNISVAVLTSTASMLFSHLKVAASATNYANPGKSINKRWNKLVTKLGYGAKATALHESTKALSALDDAAERLFEYFEQDPDVLCSPGHSAKTIVHYARGFLTHTCVRLVVQSVVDTFLRFAEGLRTDDGKPTSEDGDAEDGLFAAFVLDEDTLREKLEATVFDMSVCSQTVLADFVKLFAAHEDAEARRSVLPIEAERTFKAIVSDKKQALFESVRQFLGESREKLLSTIKAASADRTREEKDKVREQISQLKTMIRKIQRRPTGEQMAENMPRQDPHVIVDELRKHAAECNTKPLIKRLPSDSTAASSTGNELLTQSVKPLLVATKETERATEGIPECLSCLHSSIAIVSASASPVGVAGKMSVSGWTFCGPIASLQSHIRPTAGKAATPPIMSILTPNGLLSKVKIINLLFGDNALTPTSRSVFLIVDAHFPKLAEIAEAISERVNSATTQWPKLGFLVITGPGSRDMIATSDMCTNAMRFFASGALNTELFWYLEPGILGMTPVWNSRGLYSVATPLDSALDRTERDWFAIVMAKEKSQRLSVAKLSTRLEVDVEKPDEGLELLETILVDNAKKHPQFREWKRTIQAVNRAASKSPLQVITAFVECVRHLSEFIVASESSEHKALRAVVDDILSVDNIDKQLVAIGWVPSPFQVHTILQASPKMFRFARNYRGGSTTQNTAQLRGAVLFNTRALQNHYAGQSSTGSRTTPVGVSDVDWEDSVVESRRRFLQNMFKKTSSLAVMISFCMAPAYVKAHGPLNAPRRRSSPKKPKKRLKKT